MAQWVKDLALSLLWLGSQLWGHGFDPWPKNSVCHSGQNTKKKKRKKERKKDFMSLSQNGRLKKDVIRL